MSYWTQTSPLAPLLTFADVATHLQLDPDVAALATEQDYVNSLIDAATAYAEDKLDSSLVTRTVTAVYFTNQDLAQNPYTFPVNAWNPMAFSLGKQLLLALPRGPFQAISTVTDANGTFAGVTVERYGVSDWLSLPQRFATPLTVTFTAGYGSTAASVPANIRAAVRALVMHLYENRGEAEAKHPEWIDSFLRVRSRGIGI